MLIRSLTILHLELGSWKTTKPIKKLKREYSFFAPETCRRQILIASNLNDEQLQKLQSYAKDLAEQTDRCEILSGFTAYKFLLRWAVGLFSDKYENNDRFVLGKLREKWTEFTMNKPQIDASLIQIMSILFRDAKLIRSKIESSLVHLENEERIIQTEQLCEEKTIEKENSPVTLRPNELIRFSSKKLKPELSIKQQQQALKKKLTGLQQQAHLKDNDKKTLQTIAKLGITAAWQKKRMDLALESQSSPSITDAQKPALS